MAIPTTDDYPLEGVCSSCCRVVAFVKRVPSGSPIRSVDAIRPDGSPIRYSSPICPCGGGEIFIFCLREREGGLWISPSEHTAAVDKHEREHGRQEVSSDET